MEKLRGAFKAGVEVFAKNRNVSDALKEIQEDPNAGESAHVKIDRAMKRAVGNVEEVYAARFKRFKQELGEDDSDDDVMEQVTEMKKIPKCPITTAELTDPVKNKACNHCYSRAGILSMLKRVTEIACPVAGCQKKVSKKSLEDDHELAAEIDRFKKKKSETQEAPSYTQVD